MKNYDWLLFLGIIVIVLILDLIFALIGVQLWNHLAVNLFNLPKLTFWQFYGLEILIGILCPKHFNSNNNNK